MTNPSKVDGSAERVRDICAWIRGLDESPSGDAQPSNWTPAWSSRLLEIRLSEALDREQGSIGDVFHALWEVLRDASLSRIVGNFIKDIVVLAFTCYKSRYLADDFRWMSHSVIAHCSEAQAYCALLALPDELLSASAPAILAALKESKYSEAARNMLS
jgi:hypothetical protein